MLGLHSLRLFDLIFIHEIGEEKPKYAVKPQIHVQRSIWQWFLPGHKSARKPL